MPEIELSVFVQGELWGAMNAGIFSDKRVVAVAHAPSARRADRSHASVLEGAEALLDRGLRQLVQLDFPDSRDGTISGSWPFADGLFNLFGAPPFDTFFWAFQK